MARPRLLLVEDDPPFARTLARVLGATYDVTVQGSFGEASDLLASGARFDVYVLDLHLGDGHARDLYSALEPEARGRVVVLTGGAFTDQDHTFLRALLNPPLFKPFRREELHEALSSALTSSVSAS